jgi:uncharacterized protein (DUF58 family)
MRARSCQDPGDDLRRLDWRVYGRTDRHYVKEYEADTNLRCCLVVDSSGSMGYGSTGITRMEYARRLAGTLGFLACRQGDAVGISCVADAIVRHLPPRRNPAHLRLVLDALEEVKPEGASRLPGSWLGPGPAGGSRPHGGSPHVDSEGSSTGRARSSPPANSPCRCA